MAASGRNPMAVRDPLGGRAAGSGARGRCRRNHYRAPSEATAYGFDAFGEFGWVSPPVRGAHLERFPSLTSVELPLPRVLRCRVPADRGPRSAGRADARTLLMHDGANLFDPQAPWGGWRVEEALAEAGAEDVLVVSLDSAADRMAVYTHAPDRIGGAPVSGRADDYLEVLERDVLPFVRSRYGVTAQGPTLMVAGSSLGGLVSLYGATTAPGSVGCVAGLSSTLGWGSIGLPGGETTLIARWRGRPADAVYLDSGGMAARCVDADGDGIADDDGTATDNYCTTRQMRDVLVREGYRDGVDLEYVWEPGAEHNEAAWAARLPGAIRFCAGAGWAVR